MGGEHLNIVAGAAAAVAVTLVDHKRTGNGALIDFRTDNFLFSDAVPDISGGAQIATVAITPKAGGNILRIRGQAMIALSDQRQATLALFLTGTGPALAAMPFEHEGGAGVDRAFMISVEAEFIAVDTTPLVFELKVGQESDTATPAVVNGDSNSGARRYGGVAGSFIEVDEFA